LPCRHRTDAFQSAERLTQAVEQAGTKYDVKYADKVGAQFVRIEVAMFNFTFEVFFREQKSLQSAIGPYVDCQTASCPNSNEK